jgi:ferredoxin-NADP reductase
MRFEEGLWARNGFAVQKGRITAAWLQEHVYPHAEVYGCGPRVFMQVMISTTADAEVEKQAVAK